MTWDYSEPIIANDRIVSLFIIMTQLTYKSDENNTIKETIYYERLKVALSIVWETNLKKKCHWLK